MNDPRGPELKDEQPGQGTTMAIAGEVRQIPDATVARFTLYLRVLTVMADSGVHTVSSDELAAAVGVGASKLRKDLSYLGPSGVRGVGYDVTRLLARLEVALGLDRGHNVAIVGVGHLGTALSRYDGFSRRGFRVVALFDDNDKRTGTVVNGVSVRNITELPVTCREKAVTMGVIATPEASAQHACDLLIDSGVGCILNFAPTSLAVPPHVELRRVDLALEMQVLSFRRTRHVSTPAGDPVARNLRHHGSVSAR